MVLGESNTLPTVEYLMESGLLFEINRLILNPIGLHLGVETDEDGQNPKFADLVDASTDKEGIILSNRDMLRGARLLQNTFSEFEVRRQARQKAVGFIIQTTPALEELTKPVLGSSDKAIPESPVDPILQKQPPETYTTGAAEDIAKTSTIAQAQQKEDDRVSRSVLSSKIALKPSARSGDCPHPDANLVRERISGGGSVTFCSLCGTQFKDSDLIQ